MDLIDIGVNFHSAQLKGLTAELLARAAAAGVGRVFATGTSLGASQAALACALAHAGVWATAGVHPHGASEYTVATGERLAQLWAEPRVVAVGECGLDYMRMYSSRHDQRAAFEAQARAGVKFDKPLFLHCRDAFDDFHAMLREAAQAGAHGVVHCFTGSAAEAEAFLELGFDLGITGWVTDRVRGAELRDALRLIPLDRLHLETDAPYLRPKNAGKTRPYNEPALLPCVAQAVAELKGVDAATLAAQATANSVRLFRLPALASTLAPAPAAL
jgi:TatD DNase family protein